ncbi:hypothetical protein L218DRAFT_167969 [Marasmius fiardii PR-910]|nr:hypothetical protein L218DRAFT_167969 [Marasmius fiardii PR-910]
MAFVGVSDFSIEGSAHVHVQRDQNINYTTQVIQQKKKRTIYDEFYDVRLGAICRAQDIHQEKYPRRWDSGEREWWEEGLLRVNRTICTAKIRGQHGSRFTVVSYNGPEAKEAWKDDFRRFSRTTDAVKMQLFGINRSSVPLLIFYGDLLPLAHVWDRIGLFGKTYAGALTVSMDCDVSEL